MEGGSMRCVVCPAKEPLVHTATPPHCHIATPPGQPRTRPHLRGAAVHYREGEEAAGEAEQEVAARLQCDAAKDLRGVPTQRLSLKRRKEMKRVALRIGRVQSGGFRSVEMSQGPKRIDL
eukprot:360083-Chlamydomonas_euryale.AAC.2